MELKSILFFVLLHLTVVYHVETFKLQSVQSQNDESNEIIKGVFENDEIFNRYDKEYKLVRYQPRHVHISYGENGTSEMFITWSTLDNPKESIVEYGIESLDEKKETGTVTEFIENGKLALKQFIHRVKLTGLNPGQIYMYQCGSDSGWSEIFFFRTMKSGVDWSPTVALFGDLGNENAQSLPRLQQETHLGLYDAIIHVGDFAYDMYSDDGQVGDAFMEQIEPIAAYVPYMTCPGNHEYRTNFLQYKSRFTMPGGAQSMYYSWNMGPIHFIAFSTEFYYFLEYGITPLIKQYQWLENDLKEATKPENRAQRPWIITYGHRPMYCSNNNTDDCTKHETLVRVGVPYLHWFGLENLFMQYGVDLAVWAHEHSYERLWPLYNHQVYNGSLLEPYRNPKALVHVTTGSGGCAERHDEFIKYMPLMTAFRSTDYGYSRLRPLNHSHLFFEQISDDKNGQVIDSFYLIREKHEPYKIHHS